MILICYFLIFGLSLISSLISYHTAGKRKWLSAFCLCNALYFGLVILDALPIALSPLFYVVSLTLLFTPGPVLLAMTGIGIKQKLITHRDFFAVLIPVFIVLVWHELLLQSESILSPDWPTEATYFVYLSLFEFIALIATLHTLGYAVMAMYKLYKNQRSWQPNRSLMGLSRLNFVLLLSAFCLMVTSQTISAYANPDGNVLSIGDMAALFWLITLNYMIFKQTAISSAKTALSTKLLPTFVALKIYQPPQSKADPEFSNKIARVMEKHFDKHDFSVQHMAKELYLSPRQLQRKVQVSFGCTPKDYLKNFRLEKAKQLLHHSEQQIGTVAYNVGFSSPAYFGACFKEKFQLTPSQYKQIQSQ